MFKSSREYFVALKDAIFLSILKKEKTKQKKKHKTNINQRACLWQWIIALGLMPMWFGCVKFCGFLLMGKLKFLQAKSWLICEIRTRKVLRNLRCFDISIFCSLRRSQTINLYSKWWKAPKNEQNQSKKSSLKSGVRERGKQSASADSGSKLNASTHRNVSHRVRGSAAGLRSRHQWGEKILLQFPWLSISFIDFPRFSPRPVA